MLVRKFEEINLQLAEASKAILERERILDLMGSIDKQLADEREILPILITRRNQERKDVEELEGISIKSLFATILQNRDERLDQEVEEYVEAKLVVANTQLRIEHLETYLLELEDQLVELASYDEIYDTLKQEQVALLSKLDKPEVDCLQELLETLPSKQMTQQTLQKVYVLGQEVLAEINKVINILEQGRDFFGNWGVTSKITKRIDPIRESIELSLEIQQKLERFQQDLKGTSLPFLYSSEMETPAGANLRGSMVMYTKVGATSKLTDLEAQPRIRAWLSHLKHLQMKVKKKVERLEGEIHYGQREIEKDEGKVQEMMKRLWNETSFRDVGCG